MFTRELTRAAINRDLVANQVGAETYDKVCHSGVDGQNWLKQGTCPPEIWELVPPEVSLEDDRD